MNKTKFFAGTSRPLRFGMLGFCIAAGGAAVGFAMGNSYGPDNPWSFLVFAVVAFGVLLGFASVIWGWLSVVASASRR